ncbi:MAG TPA: AI-2E family transporter [Polymorphobacter sp.]|nr:AI-2E family transporter [Polymorphobacter sp.]
MTTPVAKSASGSVALTLCAVILLGAALHLARVVFEPVAFALFLVALVWPLQRTLASKLPKGLALIITMVTTLAVIAVFAVGAAWSAGQIGGWVVANFGRVQAVYVDATAWLEAQGLLVDGVTENRLAPATVMSVLQTVAARLSDTTGFIMLAFVFIVLGLLEVEPIGARLRKLAGDDWNPAEAGAAIAKKFQTYMRVRGVASVLTGISTALFAYAIGLQLPLVWGVLAFILNFIPFIGPLLVVVPAMIFAAVQFGSWQMVLLVAAGMTAIQFVIGSYLEPIMAGTAVSVSPFLVLLSVFLWGFLWGIPGAFIGVPMTIAILTVCEQRPSTRWIAELLAGPEKK